MTTSSRDIVWTNFLQRPQFATNSFFLKETFSMGNVENAAVQLHSARNAILIHVFSLSVSLKQRPSPRRSTSPDKFKRPTPPPSPNTHSGAQQPQPPLPPPAQPMVQSMSSPAAMSQHAAQQPPSQP